MAYEKIFELPLPANVFVTGKNFMKMMKSGKMHVEDVITAENTKVKSSNDQDDTTGSINSGQDIKGGCNVCGQIPGDGQVGDKVSGLFYFYLVNMILLHRN